MDELNKVVQADSEKMGCSSKDFLEKWRKLDPGASETRLSQTAVVKAPLPKVNREDYGNNYSVPGHLPKCRGYKCIEPDLNTLRCVMCQKNA